MTEEVQPTHDEVDTGTDDATLNEDTAQASGHDEWQEKYKSLQPEYTRTTQELKAEREAREALEAQLAALQQPEHEEDEYEDFDFEDSVARQEVQAIKAELEQIKREKAELAEAAYITDQLEDIETEVGRELGQKASDWIGRLAQELRGPDGKPDVRAAYADWAAAIEDERKTWVKTKRAPKPGSGTAAVEKIDKSNPKARIAAANQRLQELQS